MHCEELSTGQRNTGILKLHRDGISVDIFRYDDFLNVDADSPIYLRTEKNDIVSLHDNVSGPAGEKFQLVHARRTTYHQSIVANTALVGPDKWSNADVLKRVHIEIDGCNDFAKNKIAQTSISKLSASELADVPPVFSVQCGDHTIECHYSVNFSFERQAVTNLAPYFTIHFSNPITVDRYLAYVLDFCDFVSLSLGQLHRPTSIEVFRLSLEEDQAEMKQGRFRSFYSVHYVWPNKNEKTKLRYNAPLYTSRDADSLATLCSALSEWIKRSEKWRKANRTMLGLMTSPDDFSSDRIVRACNWLHEIPDDSAPKKKRDDKMSAIAEAAIAKANEVGLQSLSGRIGNALSNIAIETHANRFRRLYHALYDKLGTNILGDNLLSHLELALKFRNRAAHGFFVTKDAKEFHAFVLATYAMEAFCFLLTIAELPQSSNFIERVKQYPFVRRYRELKHRI